jgi:prephenate dehydrogenase
MIGIVGFGRFGELAARYLAREFEVVVSSRSAKATEIMATGARPCTFEEACKAKMVILCVPISAMPATLQQMSPLLKPDALVADVCSVKIQPVQWMQSLLPSTVSILPTHPMFGPDSAATSLKGCKIVLCPGRVDPLRYARIKTWLTEKGLMVIETSPEDHDRKIAISLTLTHFIGRSLAEFGAAEQDIDTEGYKRLMHILGVVQHDTWQLFRDMNDYNPFARKLRMDFMRAMAAIHERLDQ